MSPRAIRWFVFVAGNRSQRRAFTPAIVRTPAGTPSANSAPAGVTSTINHAPFVGNGCRRAGFGTVRTGARQPQRNAGSGGECHPPIKDGQMMRNHSIQQPGTVEIGRCPVCGAAIYWRPGTKGQRPIYDSWACRQKAYRARQAAAVKEKTAARENQSC